MRNWAIICKLLGLTLIDWRMEGKVKFRFYEYSFRYNQVSLNYLPYSNKIKPQSTS